MLKYDQKVAISKRFIIPLLFIILVFTSFGVSMGDNYAVDLNQTADGIESELNIEDKLENSQENIVSVNLQEDDALNAVENNEILTSTYTLNSGGTFADIAAKVNTARNGDTIVLNGVFKATKTGDRISLDKQIKFTSTSGATLDGIGKSYMFILKHGSDGSSFNNLKFINGYMETTGGVFNIYSQNVKITNCNFENNYAYKGGAIYTGYNAVSAANLLIQNCNFVKNHASISVGAIGVFGNNSQILNCVFDSNYVSNNEGESSYGGAIQICLDDTYSRVSVKNCKFLNNYADDTLAPSHGGAGCLRNGAEYENCIFINNSASEGGAITFHDSGIIKNCTFIDNSATSFGGALSTGFRYTNMHLDIVDCYFEGNDAPLGGAVQLLGENVDISNSKFKNNYASKIGGAINTDATVVNIHDSTFDGNTANVDGGAIFIKGDNSVVKNCSFNSNSAIPDVNKLDDGLGGAIYINSTQALVQNSNFYYNTARNGSAIYYDKEGRKLTLNDNVMYQNQAWVYQLPIYAEDIYHGDSEVIKSIIHGGNNIARYGDLAVSNAIYNAADNSNIVIDGETPISGATTSGQLYQDDREYNMLVLLTVVHEDGSVVYNNTLNSNCFGEVSATLNNLKVGKYYVSAKHIEDTYYKGITNTTSFKVTAKIDDRIIKSVNPSSVNYNDIVIWTLNITNHGPSNATNVVVRDILPEGLIWIEDDTNGKFNPKTGTLVIDSLEVGKTIIVNIKTMVNKTGNIVNDANVTANEYDYNLTNNYDNASLDINSATDLAIVKLVNVSSPNFGDLVKWTVRVTNNGPDVAHDVVVSDVLPGSLVFVSSSSRNYNKDSGVWSVGTLNNGASASLDIICRVNATGRIENVASVSGREYDYDKSNNQDDEHITVPKSSDLEVVKLVNVSSPNFGDLVKWTVRVTNNGPDGATGVKISDVLPRGFIFVSSSKPYVDGVIDIGSLAVGRSVSVDIVSRVNITGSFVNVAEVSGNEYDWNLSNNKDEASVLVNPATDLTVTKKVNCSSPNFGDLVKWTVRVVNNGPDVAHDVVVSDVLPKSLVFVSSSSRNYNVGSGVWSVGTLNKGASASLDIVCRVNATGTIENVASVSGREYDYNKSNNRDDESISVPKSSDLAVIKLANVSSLNYGDLVKWTVRVTNNGPDGATGVKISDVLPRGFIFVSSSKPYVDGVIDIGSLAVGRSVSVDIVSRVNITGSFVNVAEVSGNEYDWNLSNNKDEASVLVNPATDLTVTKKVNCSSPNFGDLVKWTVRVVNNGPDVAHDVVVSDVLPKSLVFVSSSSRNYNVGSGVWSVGTLNKGASSSLDIVCRVNATGNITNIVTVTGREYDYNKSNNHDNETINVPKATDLAVIKLANVTYVNYGQFVKWTVIAINNGPDNATGVYVDEILPEGLILINYTKTKGIFDNGLWSVCCIESGSSESLELICKVNKTGTITNFVEISGNEYDPDRSNNKNDSSIFVPLSSDLAVVKQVNNSNPNFGDIVEWSIIVTNNGPDDATYFHVIDRLPKGLKLIDYESSNGIYKDGLWNIDYLANGDSETLLIRCSVNSLDDIENFVKVIPSEYDWNMSNNNDSEIISVSPVADISISKLINVSDANYLDLVKWSLIVTNNGPNDATGVCVSDVIPYGLEIVKVSGGRLDDSIWEIGNLANGQSKQLDIICKVKSTGNFVNFAYVWAEEFDPDLTNNEDENYLYVAPAADLSITKTVSKQRYSVGDVVRYSIRLTNNGPDRAENVEVEEVMDDSLLLKSFEASYGDFDKGNNVWSLDLLDSGKSAVLKINALATNQGTARNNVSASSDTYDPDLTNNNDSTAVKIVKNKKHNDKNEKHRGSYDKDKSNGYPESILEKYVSGNPFMLIVILFMFSLGAFCGNNLSKKR